MILLAATPSPLWYASRATGVVSFLLLSLALVLGMAQTVRFKNAAWPKYLTVGLHRDVSLMVLAFLAIHGATAVLDPFARLGPRDALVPFASWYRPLWMGLGVLAGELFVALVVTSLLRARIGYRLWRAIHWTAYLSWPLGLLHSLGTGSDPRHAWFVALTAAAVVLVAMFLVLWRLSFGWPVRRWPRISVAAGTGLALVALSVWALNGPLAPGWATYAGTPVQLLESAGK